MKKRVLIKKEQVIEVDGKKKVFGFEKYYVDPAKDFHCKSGVIRKEDLAKKPGTRIPSAKGEFVVLDADFLDDYKHLRRNAQIIGLKDIGPIITNTGINRDSKVLEAGVGSGALTCYLAAIAKKVVSYDVDERSLATARENIERFGFKNVTIKEGSIYDAEKISEKGFDVMALDLPEPWNAVKTAQKCLKVGGFLAVYVPHVMQVQKFVTSLPGSFLLESVFEVMEREWLVDEMRTRPTTRDHAHTGFLAFARRLY